MYVKLISNVSYSHMRGSLGSGTLNFDVGSLESIQYINCNGPLYKPILLSYLLVKLTCFYEILKMQYCSEDYICNADTV